MHTNDSVNIAIGIHAREKIPPKDLVPILGPFCPWGSLLNTEGFFKLMYCDNKGNLPPEARYNSIEEVVKFLKVTHCVQWCQYKTRTKELWFLKMVAWLKSVNGT
jgi:hypothetical protein